MKRIFSILFCLSLLFAFTPAGLAEETNPLPQTPQAYASSDYARYGTRLAGGLRHAATVLLDGTVEAWGDNTYGQLAVPAEATGIKALAAGSYHTLALKEDGTLVAWGLNDSGQCDIPTVLAGERVKVIAACEKSSAALTPDNKIIVWGVRGISDSNVVDLNGQSAAVITMNDRYLMVLGDDGAVTAWDRYKEYQKYELPASFSSNVVAIASGSDHVLALKDDGTVACWGDPKITSWDFSVPAGLSNVGAVAAGSCICAALTAEGTVTVWLPFNSATPALPPELGRGQALGAGVNAHSNKLYILQEDGTPAVWDRFTGKLTDVPDGLDLYSNVSSNNKLSGLSVSNAVSEECGISPVLNCAQTEYTVDVSGEEVYITAQTFSSKATLEINGEPAVAGVAAAVNGLAAGDNPISIEVTAESGSQRTYILNVYRVVSPNPLPQNPEAYQASDYAVNARRLATGVYHSLALKKDGTVVAWGMNSSGQCNVLYGLDNVVALAAGASHSLALKGDGTVAAWGADGSGQCQIPAGLADVVDIAAGGNFSAALDKFGTIVVWGDNSNEQCNIPAGLSEAGDVADIQCGQAHMLALKKDGTVVAWGNNSYGQCEVPAGLNNVVAIAAGTRQSMALKANGNLVIWGKTEMGQDLSELSVQYVAAITAGASHGAAIKWDGRLTVWGAYRDTSSSYADFDISSDLGPILAVSSSSGHLLGLSEEGTVIAAGIKIDGQSMVPLGLNLLAEDAPYSGPSPGIPQTPEAYAASDYAQVISKFLDAELIVLNMDGTIKTYDYPNSYSGLIDVPAGLNNVKAIVKRHRNGMALKGDGTVVIWGDNDDNQCTVPDYVRDVKAIAASAYCFLALKTDGTVDAWGDNSYGECDVPENLSGVKAIAAGVNHCLALKTDGTVMAWGDNSFGKCDIPAGLVDVAYIYAKEDISIAINENGTVVAWGKNDKGQCDVPNGLNGVVNIASYGDTYAALKGNGTVTVWGDNNYGARNVPAGLHDVASVALDGEGVFAVKKDGKLVFWGINPRYDFQKYQKYTDVENAIALLPGATCYAVCRGGTVKCVKTNYTDDWAGINAMLAGVNLLANHYFAVNSVDLIDPAGQSINSVAGQGGYRIKANIGNNYCEPQEGLVIVQVRGGSGATSAAGGRVLGCIGLEGGIPVVEGSNISTDFTMPGGLNGPAYVDIFVWEDWDTMVPRANANQSLNFTVTE